MAGGDLSIEEQIEASLAARRSILQKLLSGHTTAQSTAEQLAYFDNTNYWIARNGDSIYVNATNAWTAILTLAQDDPSQHQKLVEVLICMSELPTALDANGDAITAYGRMRFWADLPTFDWHLRDIWNEPFTSLDPGPERDKGIKQWINANAFAARLTATGRKVLGFQLFGLWTLRDALEEPFNEPDQYHDPVAEIPAAAMWMDILGSSISHWTTEYPSGPREGAPGKGGELWNGKHGFCKERWALWRRRFRELSTTPEVNDEVKEVAARATNRMAEVEEEDQG